MTIIDQYTQIEIPKLNSELNNCTNNDWPEEGAIESPYFLFIFYLPDSFAQLSKW